MMLIFCLVVDSVNLGIAPHELVNELSWLWAVLVIGGGCALVELLNHSIGAKMIYTQTRRRNTVKISIDHALNSQLKARESFFCA